MTDILTDDDTEWLAADRAEIAKRERAQAIKAGRDRAASIAAAAAARRIKTATTVAQIAQPIPYATIKGRAEGRSTEARQARVRVAYTAAGPVPYVSFLHGPFP